MNENSENPKMGKAFEQKTKRLVEKIYGMPFNEKVMNIGNPPAPHFFDLVSEDESIIIECKCYKWTDGGNVPSAKLATLDEAILYLKSVCKPVKKIIAMYCAIDEKRGLTLADYFCQKKKHLLDDIAVWEIDEENKLRIVR